MMINSQLVDDICATYKKYVRENGLACGVDFSIEVDDDEFVYVEEMDLTADGVVLCPLSHLNSVITSLECLRDITEKAITEQLWK